MNYPFQKWGICLGCNTEIQAVLHVQLSANGSKTFLLICAECQKRNPFGDKQFFMPRELVEKELTQEQINDLPAIMPELFSRCAVCGNRSAELHHWAPKGIFGEECSKWPKDYLCIPCHLRWHRMTTPQLVIHET
jgi:protein-arginine kinase activator protein McsA